MNRRNFLHLWSLIVGTMDACTGLLLVCAPATALELMKIPPIDATSWVFLSWMGIFIGSVGLSYGLVFRGSREAETVWIFTAAVRSLVTLFLISKIAAGALPPAWALVAVSDGIVAAGQWIILRLGWWKGTDG